VDEERTAEPESSGRTASGVPGTGSVSLENEHRLNWRPGPLYAPIRAFCVLVKSVFTRSSVSGLERLPRSGGVLLVSNHLSLADPVVLMAISPRPLMFMAKEELYRPLLARLILRLWGGSFPVRRGATDIRAIREAFALLDAGAALVLFPEGTRRTAGLGEAHRGVGYLAARAGKPVIPVGIVGTEAIKGLWDLRRLPRFEVRFGEPFTVSAHDGEDPTDVIMRRIAALLPPERRGAYLDSELARAR
jgi:1-acyl-sn-glycerol-3-phosphate acyltransferase